MLKTTKKEIFWIFLLPFILVTAGITYEVINVAITGMCPGHPPDIAPVRCSVTEFLRFHLITPFAVGGLIGLFFLWVFIVAFTKALAYGIQIYSQGKKLKGVVIIIFALSFLLPFARIIFNMILHLI